MSIKIAKTAIVEGAAEIGPGTQIWDFCKVRSGAKIGQDCILGNNVYVEGGVVIGDRCRIQNNVSLYEGVILSNDVFIGPSAVFTNVRDPRADYPQKPNFGHIRVESGATIGANATLICSDPSKALTIGTRSFVAAGAVVNRDVFDHNIVMGTPAKPWGLICKCGQLRKPLRYCLEHLSEACRNCGGGLNYGT